MKTKKRRVAGALLPFGFLVFLAAELPAQVANGKRFEFSTSASVWNVKMEYGETQTIINVPLRLGFYAWKGLEFEPELFLTIPEESEDTGILAFGNIAYNFQVAPNLLAFLLGGVGFGNGAHFYNIVFDYDDPIFALNVGAGLKAMVGNSAAIRFEYRYISYSADGQQFRTDHNVLAGVSIFF